MRFKPLYLPTSSAAVPPMSLHNGQRSVRQLGTSNAALLAFDVATPPIGPLGRVVFADATTDLPALVDGAVLMIDSRTYMPIIVERAAAIAMATDADLMIELDRLRFAG